MWEELFNRICRDHDDQAINLFYEKSKRLIYGYIRNKYPSKQTSDIDDDFMGFYVKLMDDGWRRLCAWQGNSHLTTYLIAILRNFLIGQHHANREMADENEIENITENPWDDVDTELHTNALRQYTKTAMESLSERDKELIQRTLAEEPAAQIAAAFNINTNAYYQAYRNAQQRLVAKVREGFPEYFEEIL